MMALTKGRKSLFLNQIKTLLRITCKCIELSITLIILLIAGDLQHLLKVERGGCEFQAKTGQLLLCTMYIRTRKIPQTIIPNRLWQLGVKLHLTFILHNTYTKQIQIIWFSLSPFSSFYICFTSRASTEKVIITWFTQEQSTDSKLLSVSRVENP